MAARALFEGVKAPIMAAGRAYNAAAQRRPLAVGTATTVVKTSAADMFAQTVMEGKEWDEVDWRRHALFCGFGLVYLGGFQYWLYNRLFVRWCGPITRAFGHCGAAPVKTFIDQGIHHPFVYFPAFYGLKGAVEGRAPEDSAAAYWAELPDNCKALWTIWVPAQLVNFGLVPGHLRIPYVAGVSFLWTVVLSVMRGALRDAKAPTGQQLQEAVECVAAAAGAAVAPAGSALAEAPPAGAGGDGGSGSSGSSSGIIVGRLGAGSGDNSGSGDGSAAPLGLRALAAQPPREQQ